MLQVTSEKTQEKIAIEMFNEKYKVQNRIWYHYENKIDIIKCKNGFLIISCPFSVKK